MQQSPDTPAQSRRRRRWGEDRQPNPNAAIVRASGLPTFFDCSTEKAWKLTREPDFPAPVILGERARGYLRDDLIRWLQSRKAA